MKHLAQMRLKKMTHCMFQEPIKASKSKIKNRARVFKGKQQMIIACLFTQFIAMIVPSTTFAQTRKDLAFKNERWYLNNKGVSQEVLLDHTTAFKVQGRTNEDLGLSNLPPRISSKKVKIAVLDTGVDADHPGLRLSRKPKQCEGLAKFKACLESKARGECEAIHFESTTSEDPYPLDCHGWSVVADSSPQLSRNSLQLLSQPDFDDRWGHGTLVAEVASSCSHQVEVVPVRVLSESPQSPVLPLSLREGLSPFENEGLFQRAGAPRQIGDALARAVVYALHQDVDVINISLSWPEVVSSALLENVLKLAVERGVIVVAAAGNDHSRELLYPCAYPGVICVGAHGPDGALTHFSNYGSNVDIAGPGLNILGAWPRQLRSRRFGQDENYELLSGTSQASPLLSCLAGDMIARGIPREEVRPRLLLGARPLRSPLPLVTQMPHEREAELVEVNELRGQKWVLSGNADLGRALLVEPQPLILAESRKRGVIEYPEKVDEFELEFGLKNEWRDLSVAAAQSLSIEAFYEGMPLDLSSLSDLTAWNSGEVKRFKARLRLDQIQGRVPSQLDIDITIRGAQKSLTQFKIGFEIIRPLGPDRSLPAGTLVFGLKLPGSDLELPEGGLDADFEIPSGSAQQIVVDLRHDPQNPYIDYFLVQESTKDQHLKLSVLRQSRKDSPTQGSYSVFHSIDLKMPEGTAGAPLQVHRLHQFAGHRSVYVVTLSEGRTDQSPEFSMWVLSRDLKLLAKFAHDGLVNEEPLSLVQNFDDPFYWVGDPSSDLQLPMWLAEGPSEAAHDTSQMSARQFWNYDPEAPMTRGLRLYYLTDSNELRSIAAPSIERREFIVLGLLPQNNKDRKNGSIRALLREQPNRNLPRFIYFEIEMADLQWNLQSLRPLFADSQRPFDVALSPELEGGPLQPLNLASGETAGLFWFSSIRPKETLLSIFKDIVSAGREQFANFDLKSVSAPFDGVFRARYASLSPELGPMVFALTNSEIQFHHLSHHLREQKIATTSLRRYSYYRSYQTNDLNQPTQVFDQKLGQAIPALFTFEQARLPSDPLFIQISREQGHRFVVPDFNRRHELTGVSAPAALRFEIDPGCILMNRLPHWDGQRSWIDIDCETQLLRVPLVINE